MGEMGSSTLEPKRRTSFCDLPSNKMKLSSEVKEILAKARVKIKILDLIIESPVKVSQTIDNQPLKDNKRDLFNKKS